MSQAFCVGLYPGLLTSQHSWAILSIKRMAYMRDNYIEHTKNWKSQSFGIFLPVWGFILVFLLIPVISTAADTTAESGRLDSRLERRMERMVEELGSAGGGETMVVVLGTLTYSDTGIGSEFSAYLGEKLRKALRDSPRFQVSDSENLDKVMEQMKLALSGLADETGAPEVGKLKSATALLEGRYYEERTNVVLSLELTDVETGLSIAGEELRLGRGEIPRNIALLPENYQDAMEVVAELSDIMKSSDEGLETRVWTARGNGATYRDSEELVIRFFANRPCFIKVYHIDVHKKTSLIFPNEYYSDNRIKAGKIYSIPDAHYPFRFELGAPYGTEFIKVVASTKQFKEIEEAFSNIGEADSRVMTRGLAVKAKDELRAENMISYTIVE